MKTKTAPIALLVLALAVAATPGAAREIAHRPLTMIELADVVGDTFDLPAPPAHLSVEERAHWITEERPMLGRTPMGWVRYAESLGLRGGTGARADLATEVIRVNTLAGNRLSASDVLDIQRRALALPRAVRDGFAAVVATVADVYAEQLPIAAAVAARIPGVTLWDKLLTVAERDAMAAGAERILSAVGAFRTHTLPAVLAADKGGSDAPLFTDPEGLIVLGGTGDAEYTRAGTFPDPILVIEPAGADVYRNSAGGACPVEIDVLDGPWMACNGLVVSVVADLGESTTGGTDDQYLFTGVPSAVQGSGGPGGIGLLVDVAGDDFYRATMTRSNSSPFFQYFDGGAQGFAYSGFGLLLDGLGDDLYRFNVHTTNSSIWALGQGFGGSGGLGILHDASGEDVYESHATGPNTTGFVGVYTDGTGFYGGVGIQLDTGLGNDEWIADAYGRTTDYYAQAFGAFGGLGVLYDDGGDDRYYSFEAATASFINPLLNCAYGTASFGGVGVMIEVAGNDDYYGGTQSTRDALVMDYGAGGPGVAYGVFVDTGGNDRYEMEAIGNRRIISGHGEWHPGVGGDPLNAPLGDNTFGTYVDIGGNDTYVGTSYANNSQWAFGIDRGV